MSSAALPPLADVLATARVVSLPLAAQFRGIRVREAVVFEGARGVDRVLTLRRVRGCRGLDLARRCPRLRVEPLARPAPRRGRGQRDDARGPGIRGPPVLARYDGCRTVKVKVAEAVRPSRTTSRVCARCAKRWVQRGVCASTPTPRGTSTRPSARCTPWPSSTWSTSSSPARGRRARAAARAHLLPRHPRRRRRESVRKAADPLRVARAGAADLLVIKAQPLGGVHAAREIVAQGGLPAVVSSALDTSIGTVDGGGPRRRAARARVRLRSRHRVALHGRCRGIPAPRPGGLLSVERPRPTAAELDRVAADDERTTWWLDRLRRCHALLELTPR